MPAVRDMVGRRILVVEDEFLLAYALVDMLEDRGAEVLGPTMSVDQALGLIEGTTRLDGALLDINLHGEISFAVADALAERGIPFTFATGYDESVIPARFADVPCHQKPLDPHRVLADLIR
ncbi:MAG TPA: response regulator [Frateuria sp.]|uniref:response regulator n=1 Tax=Frateuria sp. TaxID=2211372 RepID=UPI002D804559|nr:response regulator [Frateuria sp.]HET6805542.1 response regulator [Frateuria sp.]